MYFLLKLYPPEDYRIILHEIDQISRFSTLASKNRNIIHKKMAYYLNPLPYIYYQLHDGVKIPVNTDLIYASQHIISTEKPWLVDVELVSALSGYFNISPIKKIIEKKLNQKNCKKILPWSEWSKGTITNCFKDKSIIDKIQVVRHTVPPQEIKKNKDDSIIKILFVGTINPGTVLNFEFKGLYETIDAFLKLQKEYKNKIQLIVRSTVPNNIKQIIDQNDGIVHHDRKLSQQEMHQLFSECHIFPHVGYEVMNISVLEAMSYGISVIATDLFNSSELIKNEQNGFLIKPLKSEVFYDKYGQPNESSPKYVSEMKKERSYLTKKLAESIRILIEDKKLCYKMGIEAHKSFIEGEFSIKKRNLLLKKIFDEATL